MDHPENFNSEAVRLINEQKATMIIEHLAYDLVEDKFDLNIFHRRPDQAGVQQGR